ncbi:MAG: tetratricopeptide repeat protein, partial [Bacteroidales bacterium]|nr:tetratricopeptide repeat protein [Bacteroidales bacterium]
MKLIFRVVIAIFLWVGFLSTGFSQQTAVYDEPEAVLRDAMDLYEKEKYGAAREKFDYLIDHINNPNSVLRIRAEYYDALCAVALYNDDAAYQLDQFLADYPASSYKNRVNFQLGLLSYRDRKYSKALENFESVDMTGFSAEEKSELFFKKGYCYFRKEENQKAVQEFKKVVNSNSNSKYSSPSSYYLAHIAYADGLYDEALTRFQALESDPNFSAIAPYYIVQIYFHQGKYQQVIDMAPPLLINATPSRATELTRVLGESYFNLGEYEKALPYLKQYQQEARTRISRADNYKYGFALYTDQQYDQAVNYLQKATGREDTLAQYAWYYLGASYLQTGEKQFAANAFTSAYKIPFDREIREDALFKQAQLAFELSYDPYNEAVKALRNYIKAYPDSERADEAWNFLFRISLATRNYEDARDALENIRVKGPDYKSNFQKITYYRGIELFNQFEYEEAGEMFKKAYELNTLPNITNESLFWMAETFYRQENYWAAKKYYLEFLSKTGAKKLDVYNLANYNLAYSSFNRKEYSGAIYYFKQFIANLSDEEQTLVADAFLRTADSWFISKEYDNAIEYYNKAINLKVIDVDYALFQKAKALGVLQRYPEKIQTLKQLASAYPKSGYVSEAYYESGNTYLLMHDNEKALISFKKVISDYPKSNFAIRSRLKAGLIYYNNGLNDLAIKTFKGVVEDYPATPESKEALASLRNIYVDLGRVSEYIDYAGDLSFANITASEQDSISYASAENLYMSGKYDQAASNLQQYVDKFPNGAFGLSARFYLAESYYQNDQPAKALENYEAVVSSPQSEFTESALLKSAQLQFDAGENEKSLAHFNRLATFTENKQIRQEALYGQMKNNFVLGHLNEAIEPAGELLKSDKISDEMKLEAMLIRARSLLQTGEILLAKSQFKDIVTFSQGAAGAEAKYRISEIEFKLKDYEAA